MKQLTRSFLYMMLLCSSIVSMVIAKNEDTRYFSGGFNNNCNNGCNNSCSNSCSNSCNNSCNSCNSCNNDCFSGCNNSCNSCNSCETSCCDVCHSYVFPRPVGRNLARQDSNGVEWLFGNPDRDPRWVDFAFTFEYERTYKSNRIARCLVGNNNPLIFTGSAVPGRTAETDNLILADQFGLAPNFDGSLLLKPRIENFIFDFNWLWQLGDWWDCLEGLYFRINAPVVHTRWSLNACESETATSSTLITTYPTCEFATTSITPPSTSIKEALSLDPAFGDFVGGAPGCNFNFCNLSRTDLANLDLILGWNFWNCDNYHLGAYFMTVAPTARRHRTCEFFSPVTDVKNWRVGGGLQGHLDLWDCGDDHNIAFYFDGYAVSLIKHSTQRTFDLSNGCLSRYMLLKEFDADNTFTGTLVRANTFTTRNVESKFNVEGEALFQFVYRHCGWTAGLGYNLYGRSSEKLCVGENCITPATNLGILGNAGVCGQTWVGGGTGLTGGTVPLNATESNATIYGTGSVDNAVLLQNLTPPGTYEIAFNSPTAAATPVSSLIVAEDSQTTTGAPDPVYLTDTSIDVASGRSPSYLSHKVFAYVDHEWMGTCDCWVPFVGLGGEVEFTDSKRCCSFPQWGIWFKTGVAF
jgi:hypothetical protein